MHVQNLMNSLWDIRIFLGLVPKESHCISVFFYYSVWNTISIVEGTVCTTVLVGLHYFGPRTTINFSHRIPLTSEGNVRFPSCFVSLLYFSVDRTRWFRSRYFTGKLMLYSFSKEFNYTSWNLCVTWSCVLN